MRIERNLSAIPNPLKIIFLICVLIQLSTTWIYSSKTKVNYKALTKPESINYYQLLSLGSISFASQMLTLKLQLHDNQQGRYINYKNLSYPLLSKWLVRLQSMNPNSEYSALLAARVFSNTNDHKQLRLILKTVIKLFKVNPQKNWRWMAEGAVIAKYHLGDLDLALTMAKEIALQPKDIEIPAWARDLEFIMLEELNLIDAATYIVEQSLKDNSDMHPDEERFLKQRLLVLKQKSVENSTKDNNRTPKTKKFN